MKIINICSNYGSYKDGIGSYSMNLIKEIMKKKQDTIKVISPNIENYSKIKKMVSLKMSKSFIQTIKILKNEKYDIVNIEYPFTEWNPIIILFYKKLCKACKKTKTRLILSLHEYERVNFLRKKTIDIMVKNADTVLVTSEKTKNNLINLNDKIYVRDIPSNINFEKEVNLDEKDKKQFVFFGLINKSKAFNEMIAGWRKFHNNNKECKLIIITSSDIELKQTDGLEIRKNLPDEEIADIMIKSMYAILPIKPCVGYNNATLKTATLCGTIPIGKFLNEIILNNKKFYINMENYEEKDFYNILEHTQKINNDELKSMQEKSLLFGSKYSISNTANIVYQTFSNNF